MKGSVPIQVFCCMPCFGHFCHPKTVIKFTQMKSVNLVDPDQ